MLEWFQQIEWGALGGAMLYWSGHVVAWLLILIGFAGTFLPLLPGPFLILAGAVVHRLWVGPEYSIGWPGFIVLTILFLLTVLVEYVSGAMGAKWFGSSKWGMWGALTGGILGIFFGLPGLIIGPLVGAFAFEMLFAEKEMEPAAKSTWGTLVGTAAGMAIKGAIAGVMIIWIIVDMFLGPAPVQAEEVLEPLPEAPAEVVPTDEAPSEAPIQDALPDEGT